MSNREFGRFDRLGRRAFLTAGAAWAVASQSSLIAQFASGSGALSKEQRDRLTPSEVIEELKQGNARFVSGKMVSRDYRDQQRTSAAGQFPAVAALGCVDSRAPA